jgi:hypothetical protein
MMKCAMKNVVEFASALTFGFIAALGLSCGSAPALNTGDFDAGGVQVDAGYADASVADAGGTDGRSVDAGIIDAGGTDAGGLDAERVDAGDRGTSLCRVMHTERAAASAVRIYAADLDSDGDTDLLYRAFASDHRNFSKSRGGP